MGHGALHARSRVAHFHHQHAALGQVIGCARDDLAHEIEAVPAAGERDLRFLSILLG